MDDAFSAQRSSSEVAADPKAFALAPRANVEAIMFGEPRISTHAVADNQPPARLDQVQSVHSGRTTTDRPRYD